MPIKKCEVGWMYHVDKKPCKVLKHEPPISAIPLIGLHPEDLYSERPSKSITNLRSTDTPLIRLQKLGGRKNLLCFQENEPHFASLEAPPMDSRQETNSPRSNYVFKVPAYMHHTPNSVKSHVCLTPKVVNTPFVPPSKAEFARRRRIKPWNLPSARPGYAEYSRVVPPHSFIRREHIYPAVPKYIRLLWLT
ncbi:hypothetical protein Aperf_G00000047407 [Anoplocephala perfoliata]